MQQLTQEQLIEQINNVLNIACKGDYWAVKTIQPFNRTPYGYEWDVALVNPDSQSAETSVETMRRIVRILKKTVRLKPDPAAGLP